VYSDLAWNRRLDTNSEQVRDNALAERTSGLATADSTIALALSGGGYRAAAMHAGLLGVLEDAGLPGNSSALYRYRAARWHERLETRGDSPG
jgi:hypothetical protein